MCALDLFLLGSLMSVAKFPLTIVTCSGPTAHVVVCFLFMRKTLRYETGKKSFIGLIVIFRKSNNILIWLQLQYWPFSFTHKTLIKLPVQKISDLSLFALQIKHGLYCTSSGVYNTWGIRKGIENFFLQV